MENLTLINLENLNQQDLIEGVVVHPLKKSTKGEVDPRGFLIELFRNDWNDLKFNTNHAAMTYSSFTYKGMARDEDQFHIHPNPKIEGGLEQLDRWVFIGKAIAIVADPETKKINLFQIGTGWGEKGLFVLLIPPGKYHGFLSVGGVLDDDKEGVWILNWPDQLYDYQNPSLIEGRVRFDESEIKNPDGATFNWDYVRKMVGLI